LISWLYLNQDFTPNPEFAIAAQAGIQFFIGLAGFALAWAFGKAKALQVSRSFYPNNHSKCLLF
jgi:hypothetical protein